MVNKTPITYSMNSEIGGVAPSKYLSKIEKKGQVNPRTLDTYLESHWINVEACRTDNFDKHTIFRAKAILNDDLRRGVFRSEENMYGAILGDMTGVPYEFDWVEKTKDFALFVKESQFTACRRG